jgi:hypothetical protein
MHGMTNKRNWIICYISEFHVWSDWRLARRYGGITGSRTEPNIVLYPQTANETPYSAGDKHMSRGHTLYFSWKEYRFFHPLQLMDDVFHGLHISRINVLVWLSLEMFVPIPVSATWTRNLGVWDYFQLFINVLYEPFGYNNCFNYITTEVFMFKSNFKK